MADQPIPAPEPQWKGSQGLQSDDLWRAAVTALEQRFFAENRSTRELFDEKLKARDEALALQAAKDKEHFEALNNEAGRVKAMEQKYVMDVTFTTFVKGYDEWKRTTDLAINSLSGIVERINRIEERASNVEKAVLPINGLLSRIDLNTTRVTSVEQKLATYDGIYEKIERNTSQIGLVERNAGAALAAHEKFSSERIGNLDKALGERLAAIDNQMSNWMGRVIGFSVAVSLVVTLLGFVARFFFQK